MGDAERQISVSAGGCEAEVVTLGAALKSLKLGDAELLDTFERPEENPVARGQILVPFPNRVRDGEYRFGGESFQLPIDEPEKGHAIHGLVRWAEWEISERNETGVLLSHDLHPRPEYPFSLSLGIQYSLSAAGLAVTLTATNTGEGPLPFGAGYHPYFSVGVVDEAILRVPAKTCFELDERLIPTGRVPVEGSGLDFRETKSIGDMKINACFTDLAFDEDGLTRVSLSRPEGRPGLGIWMDGEHRYVQVYTGDDIPDEKRRRKSVAVEPMTCAPNAFVSGDGLKVLQPGESFAGSWGIKSG